MGIYSDKWHRLNIAGTDRLIIPRKFRLMVMKEMHETHHFHFKKCYHTMQRIVFWPNMYQDMKTFCESCEVCQKANPYTAKTQGMLQEFRTYQKFELIH